MVTSEPRWHPEAIEDPEKRVDLEEARSALREAEVKGTTACEQVRAEPDL